MKWFKKMRKMEIEKKVNTIRIKCRHTQSKTRSNENRRGFDLPCSVSLYPCSLCRIQNILWYNGSFNSGIHNISGERR